MYHHQRLISDILKDDRLATKRSKRISLLWHVGFCVNEAVTAFRRSTRKKPLRYGKSIKY